MNFLYYLYFFVLLCASLCQLRRIFEVLDADHSGELEIEEFAGAVSDEKAVRALMRASPKFKVSE